MSYSYSYLKSPQYKAFIRWAATKPKARFLDIGPVHPGGQSITTPLFEMGWQGISIEPVKSYLDYLKKVRSNGIHLQGVVSNNQKQLFIQDQGPLGYRVYSQDTFALNTDSSALIKPIGNWSIQELLLQNQMLSFEVLHIDSRAIYQPETFSLDFSSIQPWLIILENWPESNPLQKTIEQHYQSVLSNANLVMYIAKTQSQLLQAVLSLKDANINHLDSQTKFQFSLKSWLVPKIKSRLQSPRLIQVAKDIQIVIEEERVIQTALRIVKRKAKSTSIGKRLQRFKNRNSPLPAHYYDELPAPQTQSELSLLLHEKIKAKQNNIASKKVS